MKDGKYTAEEMAEIQCRSDDDMARAEAEPGFVEALAETRAEIEAARMAREIRRRTRRSQKEIARRMHVTQPRVSAIANAKELTVTTIYRYAEAAGFRIRMTLVPIDKPVSGSKTPRSQSR